MRELIEEEKAAAKSATGFDRYLWGTKKGF